MESQLFVRVDQISCQLENEALGNKTNSTNKDENHEGDAFSNVINPSPIPWDYQKKIAMSLIASSQLSSNVFNDFKSTLMKQVSWDVKRNSLTL